MPDATISRRGPIEVCKRGTSMTFDILVETVCMECRTSFEPGAKPRSDIVYPIEVITISWPPICSTSEANSLAALESSRAVGKPTGTRSALQLLPLPLTQPK